MIKILGIALAFGLASVTVADARGGRFDGGHMGGFHGGGFGPGGFGVHRGLGYGGAALGLGALGAYGLYNYYNTPNCDPYSPYYNPAYCE